MMETLNLWEMWAGVALRFWPVWLSMAGSYLLMRSKRKQLGVFGHLLDS